MNSTLIWHSFAESYISRAEEQKQWSFDLISNVWIGGDLEKEWKTHVRYRRRSIYLHWIQSQRQKNTEIGCEEGNFDVPPAHHHGMWMPASVRCCVRRLKETRQMSWQPRTLVAATTPPLRSTVNDAVHSVFSYSYILGGVVHAIFCLCKRLIMIATSCIKYEHKQ